MYFYCMSENHWIILKIYVTVTFLKLLFMGVLKNLRTDLSVDFVLEGDLQNKAWRHGLT